LCWKENNWRFTIAEILLSENGKPENIIVECKTTKMRAMNCLLTRIKSLSHQSLLPWAVYMCTKTHFVQVTGAKSAKIQHFYVKKKVPSHHPIQMRTSHLQQHPSRILMSRFFRESEELPENTRMRVYWRNHLKVCCWKTQKT